jgi:predicted NUDIX family phosphoesterase
VVLASAIKKGGVILDLKQQLEKMIKKRDSHSPYSIHWRDLNSEKAKILEELKPSTKERIIYFNEDEIDYYIPNGFSKVSFVFPIEYFYGVRSTLEYNPTQRHPIPYCLIRYDNKYFFILRENGSGEMRLIGKKGLIGGHVDENDADDDILPDAIQKGLKREIEEEAGITNDMIKSIQLHGLIKNNDGVDSDHLGYVYEIELNTDQIKAEEDGILTGIWIDEKDLPQHYDSFESWSKIVYDNILKQRIA